MQTNRENSSSLLQDAELALEGLVQQEVIIVKEAEELFKQQVNYIKSVDKLSKFTPNVELIDDDIKKVSTLVESSSTLVEDVCDKVKQISLAKAFLEDCLAKISDVLNLKTCQIGIVEALKQQNFEEAAMHIKRYLSIDQNSLHKTISIINDGDHKKPQTPADSNDTDDRINPETMRLALEELDKARKNLLGLCQDRLIKAIQNDDSKDIDRFFKIFPMLNEHDEGLKRYAEYLKHKIVNPMITNNNNDSTRPKPQNQADKLAALFESIAKLVDSHQPLVETYYGPGHLISIVRIMQKECDRLSRKVLEEFRNETKLQQVAKNIRSSSLQTQYQTNYSNSDNYNSVVNMTNQSKVDPREVDKILNEISMIISRSEVYMNFIVQRVKDDISLKSDGESQKNASLLELHKLVCTECELNHLIQEVDGIYVMLEQFYLNESSKKAIIMDQIDVEPSSSCFVSSMIDDIFFIIKKCTKRAISTKSVEVFCAIINHCVTLLESTFCQTLEERIRNQQYYSTGGFTSAKNIDFSQAYNAIQSGRYLQSNSESEVAKAQFFSALNNLDKACDYIQTLKTLLDNDIKKLKPSLLVIEQKQDNQIEKSRTCLNELSQLTSKFSSIANSSLIQMFNATLRNRLRLELKSLLNDNPELLDDLGDVNDLARTMIIRLDRSLKDSLTQENYQKLIAITKEFLNSSLKTLK